MSRVLICGVNGFVGKHLARAFVNAGHSVDGITQSEPVVEELQGIVNKGLQIDLANKASVATIDLAPYDAIVNLAGMANPGRSFGQVELYMRVNVDVLAFIGEAALAKNPTLRLLAISSGSVYDSTQPMPVDENAKVSGSTSPYAASKLAMEKAAQQLQAAGLDCVVARPFNHIGPGQSPGFLLPDLYASLVESIKTKAPLRVGNLKTRRDYTDVRDVARAYVMLATAPKGSLHHKLYNICSGTPREGEEVLRNLQKNIAGSENIEVSVDQSRIRPNDPIEFSGSSERLKQDTGWKAEIPFDQTISDFVEAAG